MEAGPASLSVWRRRRRNAPPLGGGDTVQTQYSQHHNLTITSRTKLVSMVKGQRLEFTAKGQSSVLRVKFHVPQSAGCQCECVNERQLRISTVLQDGKPLILGPALQGLNRPTCTGTLCVSLTITYRHTPTHTGILHVPSNHNTHTHTHTHTHWHSTCPL